MNPTNTNNSGSYLVDTPEFMKYQEELAIQAEKNMQEVMATLAAMKQDFDEQIAGLNKFTEVLDRIETRLTIVEKSREKSKQKK